MVLIPVRCLYCQSDQVTKRGKTAKRKQRYHCHNRACAHQSFLLDPAYKRRLPHIKQQVIELSLNASGVRDTARVLQISTRTVLNELKQKGPALESVNKPLLHTLDAHDVDVVISRVDDAEVDEMWSFVGKKKDQRWLWHAIDLKYPRVSYTDLDDLICKKSEEEVRSEAGGGEHSEEACTPTCPQ